MRALRRTLFPALGALTILGATFASPAFADGSTSGDTPTTDSQVSSRIRAGIQVQSTGGCLTGIPNGYGGCWIYG